MKPSFCALALFGLVANAGVVKRAANPPGGDYGSKDKSAIEDSDPTDGPEYGVPGRFGPGRGPKKSLEEMNDGVEPQKFEPIEEEPVGYGDDEETVEVTPTDAKKSKNDVKKDNKKSSKSDSEEGDDYGKSTTDSDSEEPSDLYGEETTESDPEGGDDYGKSTMGSDSEEPAGDMYGDEETTDSDSEEGDKSYGEGEETDSDPEEKTTITYKATHTKTVTSCAETVTNCPADEDERKKLPKDDLKVEYVTEEEIETEIVCPKASASKVIEEGMRAGKTPAANYAEATPDTTSTKTNTKTVQVTVPFPAATPAPGGDAETANGSTVPNEMGPDGGKAYPGADVGNSSVEPNDRSGGEEPGYKCPAPVTVTVTAEPSTVYITANGNSAATGVPTASYDDKVDGETTKSDTNDNTTENDAKTPAYSGSYETGDKSTGESDGVDGGYPAGGEADPEDPDCPYGDAEDDEETTESSPEEEDDDMTYGDYKKSDESTTESDPVDETEGGSYDTSVEDSDASVTEEEEPKKTRYVDEAVTVMPIPADQMY